MDCQIGSDICIDAEPALSRDEYIIEAREGCLRQLDNSFSKHYSENFNTIGEDSLDDINNLYSRKLATLNNNAERTNYNYIKFFIVRVICSCVLLFSIILIDKADIKFGYISSGNIQKYIVHIDILEELQEVFINFTK